MAWQLIYTSAPRLLEAGRSGFGTVARHRQINPLLVAAIERFSQFSRLPGLDPARVVYAHRLVTVGGGRFHVLSCVRDAGADYTGRTNHLGHHLILDPREVAALGRSGPSPADVLLATEWCQSWNEAPLWLDAEHEIDLSQIAPQTSPANLAWARAVGDPSAAGLLASGEGSRTACLLTPRGLDLRALYAESLRLTPERLWQMTFITSLQPSDEAGDFRWLGVEAGSELAATVIPGRPVFDLTAPHTLPIVNLVEAAPAPEAVALPISASIPLSPAAATNTPAAAPTRSFAPGQRYAIAKPQPVPQAKTQSIDAFRDVELPKPASRSPLLIGLTCAAVLLVAGGGGMIYQHASQRAAERREMIAALQTAEYFNNKAAADELGEALGKISRDDLPRVRELVNFASGMAANLSRTDLAAIRKNPVAPRLRELAHKAEINLPPSIGSLGTELDEAANWSEKFASFELKADPYEAFEQWQKDYEDFDRSSLLQPAFAPLKKRITAMAAAQQVTGLAQLLSSGIKPLKPAAWFKEASGKIPAQDLDSSSARRAGQSAELIGDWVGVEHGDHVSPTEQWPSWLKQLARNKMPTGNVSTASKPEPVEKQADVAPADKQTPAVLYFAKDADGLAKLKINELSADLNFEVKTPSEASIKLKFNRGGIVRRDANAQNDGFMIGDHQMKSEPSGPKPPFVLTARNAKSNAETFSVFVGWPVGEAPLLGRINQAPELSSANLVKVPVPLPKLGAEDAIFLLQTPLKFDGESNPVLSINDRGDFDASPVVAAAKSRAESHLAAAKSLTKQATEIEQGVSSLEALRKKADGYAAMFKTESARKIRNPEAKTSAIIVGEFTMALASDWLDAGKTKDPVFGSLQQMGKDLANSKDDAEAKQQNTALLREVSAPHGVLLTQPYAEGVSRIGSLSRALAASLGDKSSLEAESGKLKTRAMEEDKKAKEIQELPLLSGKLPPGDYTLVCKAGDGSIFRLYTFEAPKP